MKKLFLLAFAMLAFSFARAGEEPVMVGFSNGWVGSEWRTQMVEDAKKVAEEYKKMGWISDIVVQSTDVTVEDQIDQIRNLMAKGCKIIIVNPNDAKAFNPVVAEAKKRGVMIVGTDTELSSKDALNICINQKEWAMKSAEWLAKKLGGKGEIACINGITGHPANTARVEGYREVFKKFPDIKVVAEVSGGWDNAVGMAAAQSIIASQPNLSAFWGQDGMTEGVMTAVKNSGRKIYFVGEARMGFLRTWQADKLDTIGVANPPGCMASALRVALIKYRGGELKDNLLTGPYGNSIYLPIPVVVTNENLDKEVKEHADKPDYFAVDGIITQEEAKAYFK